MTDQTQVTLDRAQREAIRAELTMRADGMGGDLPHGFACGDREFAHAQHRRLGRMIAVMDAIGWREQPDTPDEQPVPCSRSLAVWARREAKEMLDSFKDIVGAPYDDELDAYEAFCAIGGE